MPAQCREGGDDLPAGSDETGYADLAHAMIELLPQAESFGKWVGVSAFAERRANRLPSARSKLNWSLVAGP